MQHSITLLGSTGSVGKNVLDVIAEDCPSIGVYALAAKSNVAEMLKQIKRFKPQIAVMYSAEAAQELSANLPQHCSTNILHGAQGLLEIARAKQSKHVLAAMDGHAGLEAVSAAIQCSKTVSIANKETLVLAGELLMKLARQHQSIILPIDSEHNGLRQCLEQGLGQNLRPIKQVVLTASGGPFRDYTPQQLEKVSIDEALQHPNWSMGPKNTIDSATMVNKGIELIEARWLFDIEPQQLKAMIHRQSVIHALVEFADGNCLAHIATPDMRIPISWCLNYPQQQPQARFNLDFDRLSQLTFEPISQQLFPCFYLAEGVLRHGQTAQAIFNGANEMAVEAYLDGQFSFYHFHSILNAVIQSYLKHRQHEAGFMAINTIKDALTANQWGRQSASAVIQDIAHNQ